MTKDRVISHFSGNFEHFYKKYLPNASKNGGAEFKALCPFHDEKEPSFNFNRDTGQYYCHGCGKKGDAIHFYGKLSGLDTRRDFGRILRGIAKDFGIPDDEVIGTKPYEHPKAQGIPAATYDYTDEQGKLLFQVCRMEPKNFTQRKPDGKGGWIPSIKGVRRVLYHLPEVLKSQQVVIVEGEKDVDNLHALGIAATCNPGGAGKWSEDYLKALEGKDVVLIPDNDIPGREHMVKVAAALEGSARSIRWLELPGLPDKGDVSDFIKTLPDHEAAAERLALMITEAKSYTAPKKHTIDDAVFTIDQFRAQEIPVRRHLLLPWLKEASIIFIHGWRGSGKTWFALSILNAISWGISFGPWECEFPSPVLFLDGELPPGDVDERIAALGIRHNQENPLYIFSDAYANLIGIPRAHLASEAWRREMKRILITRKVKAWVIDNISSLASGLDENSKKDWDPINQWLLELRFSGITTILLHHTGKGGTQRGTSAREDNADCSIILKKPADYQVEQGCRFIVNFDKARVSQKHIQQIGDTEFKLIESPEGSTWIWSNVRKDKQREILRMLDEGFTYDEIKEALNVSKSYISQVKSKAIKDGYLTKDGKLTQTGTVFCKIFSDDDY